MAKRHPAAVIVFAFILIALSACAKASAGTPGSVQQPAERTEAVSNGGYREIDAASLAKMLQQKDFALVNVHVPYAGEIAGTDAFVPYDKIEENLAQLPADRNTRIVVYCRSGKMSEIAAKALVKLGYRDVLDLQGGMAAWEQAGNTPLQRPQSATAQGATPTAQTAANQDNGTLAGTESGISLPSETRTSEGGGVTIQVTPAGRIGDNLVFDTALNTHSVNLSYDFRVLATLRDDQGHTYPAASWEGGSGGHHLTGKLLFGNNPPVLKPGVKWIEIELKDIAGVSARTFRWDVKSGEPSS